MLKTRQFTIEALLQWAVREEWPRLEPDGGRLMGLGSGAAGWGQMADLGIRLPVNRFGVAYDPASTRPPHPAALLLRDILDRLGDLTLDADGVDLFGDWPDAGPEERALRAAAVARGLARLGGAGAASGGRLAQLMIRNAALGVPALPEAERPRLDWLRDQASGRELWFRIVERPVAYDRAGNPTGFERAEVDGWDRKNKRAYNGAWRVPVLVPDPEPLAAARAEWQLWRAGLDVVHGVIAGGSVCIDGVWRDWPADIVVRPSALPFAPWLDGMAAPARVLAGKGWHGATTPKPAVRALGRKRQRKTEAPPFMSEGA